VLIYSKQVHYRAAS